MAGTGLKKTMRTLIAGSLSLCGTVTAAAIGGAIPASASTVIRVIPVGGLPDAVSSKGGHVWVANFGDGTVSEIRASDSSVIHPKISVGAGPRSVSSDGTHVWVANWYDNSVSELNASTGSPLPTIKTVGLEPVSVSSDGTHVWVVNQGGSGKGTGTLTELNASNGTPVRTITPPVGQYGGPPGPIAVSSDGTHVWVAEYLDQSVSEIEPSTGQIIRRIPVGGNPSAISSDGTDVWVTNNGSDTVTEIDASTGKVIHPEISVGSSPTGVSSDGTHVWVTEHDANLVSEIDALTGKVVQTINQNGIAGAGDPTGVSSDGTHVWVADDQQPPGHVSEIAPDPDPPTIIKPPNGAPLSGTTVAMDASASNATSVEFWLLGGAYGGTGHPIGKATPTIYGWIFIWDTKTVANDKYLLLAEAFGPGGHAFSPGVFTITVSN